MGLESLNVEPGQREISWPFSVRVTPAHPFGRYYSQILKPGDVFTAWRPNLPNRDHLKPLTCYNAGVAPMMRNGEQLWFMLFSTHLASGTSVIGSAWSTNLIGWDVNPEPFMVPFGDECPTPDERERRAGPGVNVERIVAQEYGGLEDPRLAWVKTPEGDVLTVTYSRCSYDGSMRVGLATISCNNGALTTTRYNAMGGDNISNIVIFPQMTDGSYYALARPNGTSHDAMGGRFREVIVASSPSLFGQWTYDKTPLLNSPKRPCWWQGKVGPGSNLVYSPKYGVYWNFLHGARRTRGGSSYSLGVAAHDAQDPRNVLMSDIALVSPSPYDADIELNCPSPDRNVVFTCAAQRLPDGTIVLFYGVDGSQICLGVTHEDTLAAMVYGRGVDPLTGKRKYSLLTGKLL